MFLRTCGLSSLLEVAKDRQTAFAGCLADNEGTSGASVSEWPTGELLGEVGRHLEKGHPSLCGRAAFSKSSKSCKNLSSALSSCSITEGWQIMGFLTSWIGRVNVVRSSFSGKTRKQLVLEHPHKGR